MNFVLFRPLVGFLAPLALAPNANAVVDLSTDAASGQPIIQAAESGFDGFRLGPTSIPDRADTSPLALNNGNILPQGFDTGNDDAVLAPRVPIDVAGPPASSAEPGGEQQSSFRYKSLGSRMGAAKWEVLGIMAYTTGVQSLLTNPNTSFHFSNEGWFGKDTANLGIDKLTHAFNAYLFSEFLGHRIGRKTGDRAGAALPAALMGFGLQFYGELWDAHKTSSGFSIQDVTFNALGATFSYFRHTIPGLEEKLDFRLMSVPNRKIFSRSGKKHYEQQHFMFAVQLAGFEKLKSGPLRFVELHVGYRGKDFTNAERAAGVKPKRDIFFGLGLNVSELFFGRSRSRISRAIASGLNYFQPPYIATHNYDNW
ncbi:DUF2279 domain-containing protein [Sphingobium sp. AN558]|uniref:DUF2279 domain-containing protein n=1 Tax=Sphingobium sp. AN558 TaxID=3133442 RepID=UPI0030BF4BEA